MDSGLREIAVQVLGSVYYILMLDERINYAVALIDLISRCSHVRE